MKRRAQIKKNLHKINSEEMKKREEDWRIKFENNWKWNKKENKDVKNKKDKDGKENDEYKNDYKNDECKNDGKKDDGKKDDKNIDDKDYINIKQNKYDIKQDRNYAKNRGEDSYKDADLLIKDINTSSLKNNPLYYELKKLKFTEIQIRSLILFLKEFHQDLSLKSVREFILNKQKKYSNCLDDEFKGMSGNGNLQFDVNSGFPVPKKLKLRNSDTICDFLDYEIDESQSEEIDGTFSNNGDMGSTFDDCNDFDSNLTSQYRPSQPNSIQNKKIKYLKIPKRLAKIKIPEISLTTQQHEIFWKLILKFGQRFFYISQKMGIPTEEAVRHYYLTKVGFSDGAAVNAPSGSSVPRVKKSPGRMPDAIIHDIIETEWSAAEKRQFERQYPIYGDKWECYKGLSAKNNDDFKMYLRYYLKLRGKCFKRQLSIEDLLVVGAKKGKLEPKLKGKFRNKSFKIERKTGSLKGVTENIFGNVPIKNKNDLKGAKKNCFKGTENCFKEEGNGFQDDENEFKDGKNYFNEERNYFKEGKNDMKGTKNDLNETTNDINGRKMNVMENDLIKFKTDLNETKIDLNKIAEKRKRGRPRKIQNNSIKRADDETKRMMMRGLEEKINNGLKFDGGYFEQKENFNNTNRSQNDGDYKIQKQILSITPHRHKYIPLSTSTKNLLKRWTTDERQMFAIFFPYVNKNWSKLKTYIPNKTVPEFREFYKDYYRLLSKNEKILESNLQTIEREGLSLPGSPRKADDCWYLDSAGLLFKK